MSSFTYNGAAYKVDPYNFLEDFNQWDENFAEGMALQLEIPNGLTEKHWNIIHFIRDTFRKTGKCPLIYVACRQNKLHLKQLKELFPSGYQRGVCKIAGITYKEGYLSYTALPTPSEAVAPTAKGKTYTDTTPSVEEKTYTIDVRGFLVDPEAWDENYALYRAYDMKIPKGELTEKHWQIIHFLRDYHNQYKTVPTIYETCEANNIELDELERLFPDGYHRGAVKIAGLRGR
ncbi:MAG: TusE/DsrC/DsvC family sulfur relay protein [candidate division Zixibacteria bacterium]|nr:TusE/DsrC/DsvC family sulfur relay protein [candidate division Zixibacteria bacterium]